MEKHCITICANVTILRMSRKHKTYMYNDTLYSVVSPNLKCVPV